MSETTTCTLLGALQRLLALISSLDVNRRQCELLSIALRGLFDKVIQTDTGEDLRALEANFAAVAELYNATESALCLCESFKSSSSDAAKVRGSLDSWPKYIAIHKRLFAAMDSIGLQGIKIDRDTWRRAAIDDYKDIKALLANMESQHSSFSVDVPVLSLEEIQAIETDFEESLALRHHHSEGRRPSFRHILAAPPFEKPNSAFSLITFPSPHQLHPIAFRSSPSLLLGRFRGQPVVIKKVSMCTKLPSVQRQFLEDIPLLRPLCHPNIISFLAYSMDDKYGYVLMEYFDGISLSVALQRQAFSISQVLGVALQAAKGMAYLHTFRPALCHGKLNTNKIMLSRALDRVKIVGFGHARAKNSGMLGGLIGHADSGELPFVAPEYFTGGHLGPKCDVYSFGSVVYTMSNGSPPYASPGSQAEDHVIRKVLSRARDARPKAMPLCLWRLVQLCWRHELDERPDFLFLERQLLELCVTILVFPEEPLLKDVYKDLEEANALFESLCAPSEPLSPISPVVAAALRRRASLASIIPDLSLQTPSDDESEEGGKPLRALLSHLENPVALEHFLLHLAGLNDHEGDIPLLATPEGVELALDVLRAHTFHEGIQLLGFRLVNVLLKDHPRDAFFESLRTAGLDPFLLAMTIHHSTLPDTSSRKSSMPIETGSRASTDSSDLSLSTPVSPGRSPPALVVAYGGLDVILSAMRAHKSSVSIQQECCCALADLAFEDDFLVGMPKLDCVEAIIVAMRQHKLNPLVQEYACVALRNLASDLETAAIIAQTGGIDAIIVAMSAHRGLDIVQEHACTALSNIASNHLEAFDAALAARSVEAVLSSMRVGKAVPSIQFAGFGFLRNLACNQDHLIMIAKQGGVEVILSAMRSFKHDADLQEGGCALLGNLSCTNDGPYWIARGGVIVFMIEAIVAAMQVFHDSAAIQVSACMALGNIANMPENATLIAKVSGIDLILNAMRNFPDNCIIQEEACLALRNLTRGHNIANVSAAGAVDAVLATLDAHRNNPNVQGEACRMLGLLARDSHNLNAIMSLGGLQAIVSAMRAFKHDEGVQRKACWALLSIVAQSRTSVVPGEIRALGGFSLAIAARENFPWDDTIQSRARWLIQELS